MGAKQGKVCRNVGKMWINVKKLWITFFDFAQTSFFGKNFCVKSVDNFKLSTLLRFDVQIISGYLH